MRAALATFAAFLVVGLVPLLPFVVPGLQLETRFLASAVGAAIAFFGVGAKGIVLGRSGLRGHGDAPHRRGGGLSGLRRRRMAAGHLRDPIAAPPKSAARETGKVFRATRAADGGRGKRSVRGPG